MFVIDSPNVNRYANSLEDDDLQKNKNNDKEYKTKNVNTFTNKL